MRKFDCWIVAGLSCLAAAGCARTKANTPVDNIPEVLFTYPTTDQITDYEEFIGHAEAMFSVEVRARVTGYLDKVSFNDGDEVEKGATLFEIDARPYKAEFDRTKATLEQSQARLTRLDADLRRAKILLERNAIGREEFDRINGDFAEGKAAIGVALAALARSQLDMEFTRVTAPIGGRLSRRMVDPGNLVQADQTALTTIVSLDPMFVYFDVDERTLLKIRRLIAEGKIKSRREAEVPVSVGLSDEPDFPHAGKIDFSDNKVDSSTGTLKIRGIIDNPRPRIFSPGMFARVRLPIGKAHESILISEQAIGSEQIDKYVYVIQKGMVKVKDRATGKPVIDPATGKPKMVEGDVAFSRPIKVGALNNGRRVVYEGLARGEKVIVSGLQRVKAGEAVKPIEEKKGTGTAPDRSSRAVLEAQRPTSGVADPTRTPAVIPTR